MTRFTYLLLAVMVFAFVGLAFLLQLEMSWQMTALHEQLSTDME